MLHSIVDTVLQTLTQLGYWGIMLGLAIEIIPSEIVLAYGGYLVFKGRINPVEAVIFGTIGIMIAQWILYWIGLYGGRPFVEKYGKYLMLKPKYLDVAERWFERYGGGVVFTARFVPVVRQAISIPAGMARMPFLKFSFYTLLGTVPWCILFVLLGKTLGDNWQSIDEAAAPYFKWIMWGGLALFVLYFALKLSRGRNSKARHGKGGAQHAAIAAAGQEGERHTAHQLRFIGNDYKVMHGRKVSVGGSTQEFDHIVVGPNGVFHIDSKHWAGEIEFSEKGITRSGGGKNEDPTGQLYRHEYVLKELLRRHKLEADVVGVICFTHPNCELIGKSPAFETLKADRLLHFIKTHRSRRHLAADEVRAIAKLIDEHSRPA